MQRSFWHILKKGLFFAALPVGVLLALNTGSVSIPLLQVLKILWGGTAAESSWQFIVLDFRLPKVITALLAGAGLSVSGLQMQTLFRNPLAGPFVLGISSGASLGVALLVMGGTLLGGQAVYQWVPVGWGITVAAFAGALLVLLLVLATAVRVKDLVSLLIIGLMAGSLTSALVGIMQYFSPAQQIQQYLIWTFGSLASLSWAQMAWFGPVVVLALLGSLLLAKPLDLLLLGPTYAASMGLHLRRARLLIIVCTALLAGTVTGFCGPIAFIGLAVPHIVRLLFRQNVHRFMVPMTAYAGATLLVWFDLLTQLPGGGQILPINAVTALFGAPMVIFLVLKQKNAGQYF